MFYLSSGSYATVWNVDVQEKYVDLRITTSEKMENGEYKNSNWFARCIGEAFETAKTFEAGKDCRVKIGKCKFTNESYKNKDGDLKNYFRIIIFSFENLERKPEDFVSDKPDNKKTSKSSKTSKKSKDDIDDDLPF